jgi:OmpA-OmpF porin, OOP family
MKLNNLIFIVPMMLGFGAYSQTELVPTEEIALGHFFVTDKRGLPEENAKIHVISLDGKIDKHAVTDIHGKVEMLLPEGHKYKYVVRKFSKNFEFNELSELIEIPAADGETEFDWTIAIGIITDYLKVFTVDVHFESGKHDLTEKSKKAVDVIYMMLTDNKTMKIEIAGHTDNVGDDAHNLKLSQLRANALRDYLFEKGIAHDRIIAKGYGETHPLTTNDTEFGRLQNRRTEVKVISE